MYYQKTLLSKISNSLFLIFCLLILTFIWTNYYLRDFKRSLATSIIITIAIIICYCPIKILFCKRNKTNINANKELDYLKTQLLLGNTEKTIEDIKNIFQLLNLHKIKNNHYVDNINQTDFFFLFDKQTINDEDFVYIFKNKKFNNIKVFCIEYINQICIKDTSIDIINLEKINEKLHKVNTIIDHNINIQKKAKYNIKEVLRIALSKHKFRSYFMFGLLLIFSSLFTIFSTYYIVFGTILILLSIFCRFNKLFN